MTTVKRVVKKAVNKGTSTARQANKGGPLATKSDQKKFYQKMGPGSAVASGAKKTLKTASKKAKKKAK